MRPTPGWAHGPKGHGHLGLDFNYVVWLKPGRAALFFIRYVDGPDGRVMSKVLDVTEFDVLDGEHVLTGCLADASQKKEEEEVVALVAVPWPKTGDLFRPYYGPARLAWRLNRGAGHIERIAPGSITCSSAFVDGDGTPGPRP